MSDELYILDVAVVPRSSVDEWDHIIRYDRSAVGPSA